MAIVKDPLHSVAARGKVSGLIYNRSRAGNYVKAWAGPCNRRSAKQLSARNLHANLSRLWQTISSANRDLWNDYAAAHPVADWTGDLRLLSGFNWYMRCNALMMLFTSTTVATPPGTVAPDTPTGLVATGGAGSISVAWTPYGGTDKRVIVWLQGPISPGRVPRIEQASYRDSKAGESSPLALSGLSAGTWAVFAKAMDDDNGLCSAWALSIATVT